MVSVWALAPCGPLPWALAVGYRLLALGDLMLRDLWAERAPELTLMTIVTVAFFGAVAVWYDWI